MISDKCYGCNRPFSACRDCVIAKTDEGYKERKKAIDDLQEYLSLKQMEFDYYLIEKRYPGTFQHGIKGERNA